jgi:uncharacterized protein
MCSELITIPPSSGRAFELPKGWTVKIIDPEGNQVSDFVALCSDDSNEKFDQARTRVNNWTNKISKDSLLYSNRNNPILKVVQDDVGVHDIMFPCCNKYVYETIFRIGSRNGCFENLAKAVAEFGLKSDDMPNPLNIFMNTFLDSENGKIGIRKALSSPGDTFTMLALKDLIVGATACADDISECNGGKCKPINVELIGPQA